MLRLETYPDLFKYAKELLDDDYNHGQQLVIKTKNRSVEGNSETSTTTKFSNADLVTGESKLGFEAKVKGNTKGQIIEGSIKQDGAHTIDIKSNLLEKKFNVPGLQLLFNSTLVSVPTSSAPVLKAGVEYFNTLVRFKLLANLHSYLLEQHLTYMPRSNLLVGYNMVYDPKNSNLDKYDFGLTWEAAPGAFVGLRHDSTSKTAIQLGKFLFFLHHNVSPVYSVGSEFSLDCQKKTVEARFGLAHRFNEDTAMKLKVNHAGYLDVVLKHRLSNLLTVGAVTGFSLQRLVKEHKTSTFPLGFQLDFKF